MTGADFFHDGSYFVSGERGSNDEVFVGNDIPNVVYRRSARGESGLFIEYAMHDRIDDNASFRECLGDRGANQLLDVTRMTAPAASVQRFRQFADRLCQPRLRLFKLRSCSGKNNLIRSETVIHQLTHRFTTQ